MSVIDYEFGPSSYELIRERIAAILYDELRQQYAQSYDERFLVERVFIERYVPFQLVEYPAINVQVASLQMDAHDVEQSDGVGQYIIDAHVLAKTEGEIDGGYLAATRMHKLLGMCRQIIEHSEYKTLGFAPPFIMRRRVLRMNFKDPESIKDSYQVAQGRIILEVKAPEVNGLFTPQDTFSYKTTLHVNESLKGYQYFGGQEPAPVDGSFDETFDQTFD